MTLKPDKKMLKKSSGLSEAVNQRTDNAMAKRQKDRQRSTKHYAEN